VMLSVLRETTSLLQLVLSDVCIHHPTYISFAYAINTSINVFLIT